MSRDIIKVQVQGYGMLSKLQHRPIGLGDRRVLKRLPPQIAFQGLGIAIRARVTTPHIWGCWRWFRANMGVAQTLQGPAVATPLVSSTVLRLAMIIAMVNDGR